MVSGYSQLILISAMKKRRWIWILAGVFACVCIGGGIWSSIGILLRLNEPEEKIVEADAEENIVEADAVANLEGQIQKEKTNKIDNNVINDKEKREYEFPAADWKTLSKALAAAVNAKGLKDRSPEELIFAADMTDEELGTFLTEYICGLKDDENPGILSDTSYLQCTQEEAQTLIYSMNEQKVDSVLQGKNIYFENGNYVFPQEVGKSIYHFRIINAMIQNQEITVTAELMSVSDEISQTFGLYSLVLKENKSSVFSYNLLSAQKQPSIAEKFTGAEATSVLEEEGYGSYSASNVLDRNLTTAWVEGVGGLGIGESVTIYCDEPQKVHGIKILEGFAKSGDLMAKNAFPSKFRLEFSDGSIVEAEPESMAGASWMAQIPIASLRQKNYEEIDYMDFISLGKEVETSFIKLTILEVQPGTKYEDTCISEIIPY